MPKILIADDSIAVRKVAERLLTEAGMGVTLAANGSEALAILSKDRPDLIVSDVIMPDKSGYEVCAFIRAQANLADIPVLLISGIVNDEVSRQAESCKADGVLKKPFQGSSLKDRVLDLLAKRPHKPASVSEPLNHPAVVEPPTISEFAAAPVLRVTEDIVPSSGESMERQKFLDPVMVDVQKPESIPSVMSFDVAPDVVPAYQAHEPHTSVQADDRSQVLLAEREARITELEEQLGCERRQSQEQLQQIQHLSDEQREQIAELSSRTEALDHSVAEEREQRTALAQQLEDVSQQAKRVGELEAALDEERNRAEQLAQQVLSASLQAARMTELEAHLEAEREAASQLVQQITSLEHLEDRVHELERILASEREEAEHLRNERAELATVAAMVPALEEAGEHARAKIADLDGALSAEREAAAALLAQIKQLEETAQRVHDLDLTLMAEQERSMQLAKRAADAEHMAEQSTRRFEDMARKLGEIAGLASQLGNVKR